MRACPRCGTQNLDDAAACTSCSAALAPARPGLKQTMIGMAPRAPQGNAGPAAPPAAPPLIAPPPAISSPGPALQDAPKARKGTVMGVGSPFAENPDAQPFGQSQMVQTLPSASGPYGD